MFKKVLVANRGEVAVRVIRACHELGIKAVAIYTEPDRDSLHVHYADEAYPLEACASSGRPRAQARPGLGYMDIPAIIQVAQRARADAIHPGYGFLSENPHFAAVCETWGITFIGPTGETMRRAGMKDEARQLVARAGVPVLPGSDGSLAPGDAALRVAESVGYPLLVKAAAGGGGRGTRIVRRSEELLSAMSRASQEAQGAFGVGQVYLERYLERPRHVEVQVIGDHHGNLLHVGERECSLQRRRQKVLEEAPALGVSPDLRAELTRAALAAADAVGYTSMGTVEFLLDQNGSFYFIEINARMQVEHTVTEAVYLVDLVKEQILVAAGEPLSCTQSDLVPHGWALQCRITAEDPAQGLLPAPGTITAYVEPGGPGIRVDSYVTAGYSIPPQYDSMFAKVIAWGRNRSEAIARMNRALREFRIEGVKTIIPLHLEILNHPAFLAGTADVGFLEREILGQG